MSRWSSRLVFASVFVSVAALLSGGQVGASRRQEPAVHEDFDPAAFDDDDGAEVENRWTPFRPGTRFVYEGSADRGEGLVQHQVVLTVTDLVKVIDGVTARVLYDVDTSDGVVAEAELAFQAQDRDGNVWLVGEYPEEFVDGEFDGAPNTWISGVDDAQAGVAMRARPEPGTSKYLQALIPSIEFGDEAEIVGFEDGVCVPVGCFDHVLVIRETNTFVPDEGFQLKYYAAGVGNIRVEFLGGQEQEVLDLVEIDRLSRKELRQVRKAALSLDERAYENAPEIYAETPRAHREDDD
jgi:hypothetical protein